MELWVETDLEPDDVLALRLKPLCYANYYVVGEGENPNIKYNRMKRYTQLLNNSTAVIIQGFGSMKAFPNDGDEFDNLGNSGCDQYYLENFLKFSSSSNPVMFSLKPMRELLNEYNKNKGMIINAVKNIELYLYGSFNFRCVLKEHKNNLIELLNNFKKVCIYESFYATGEQNSINKNNYPLLYNYFIEHSNDPYIETLIKLTTIWNCHLRDEFKTHLKNETRIERIKRSQKVIDNIIGHEDFQYVLADFGLVAVYDTIEPVPIKNLRFDDDGYTKFDDSLEESNMYVYRDVDFNTIEQLILAKI